MCLSIMCNYYLSFVNRVIERVNDKKENKKTKQIGVLIKHIGIFNIILSYNLTI